MYRVLLFSLLISVPLKASTLTLSNALEWAADRHAGWQAARYRIDAERASATADAQPDAPRLELSADELATESSGDSGILKVGLSQSIPWFRHRAASVRAAQLRADTLKIRLEWDHQSRIRRAYRNAQAARARTSVIESGVLLARRAEQVAAERRRVGAGSESDRLRAIAERASGENQLTDADLDARDADAELAAEIGIEMGDVPELEPWMDLVHIPSAHDSALDEVILQHPYLKAALAEAAFERTTLAREQAASWLNPELGAGLGADRDRDETVMDVWMGFDLPLGTKVERRRTAALQSVSAAEREADAVRAVVHASARKLLRRVASAAESLEWSKSILNASTGAATNARIAYEAGKGSIAEWLLAERASIEASLEHINHVHQARVVADEYIAWRALNQGVTR